MSMIENAAIGAAVLRDWLGDGGKPVPLAQAQARADICLTCPHNYKGTWLWNLVTTTAIASQTWLANALVADLRGQPDLKVCDVCGCQLRLKVHVPFAHIYAHMSHEQLAHFPDFCWLTKEREQLTTP